MKIWSRKSALVLFLILLFGCPLVWRHGIQPVIAKQSAWEGTIDKRYQEEHRSGKYRIYHTYHWVVQCTDGKFRTVEVTFPLYMASDPGVAVRKLKGERWPRLIKMEKRHRHPALDQIEDKLPKELLPPDP